MSALENLSPFEAIVAPSLAADDRPVVLAVIAGTFEIPLPGKAFRDSLPIADVQVPVATGDVFLGEGPGAYLEVEGQLAFTRPGTDVYVRGTAQAPQGKPTPRSHIGVSVGPLQKAAVVLGERYWDHGLRGTVPSAPRPFTSIELSWARCFGGWVDSGGQAAKDAAARNPAGVGNYATDTDGLGKPLPNFEDPRALIAAFGDRPKPHGFGPVARHWMPRRQFGGTYDDTWVELRAPRWPPDLDERFFAAAAEGLHAARKLVGGEPVQLVGFATEGGYGFLLPRRSLLVRFATHEGSIWLTPTLDAVAIDTDARTVTLTWRASVIRELTDLRGIVVRELESWEDAP